MAIETRIDEMRDLENGEFLVAYTRGETPLPLAPGGLSISYPSRQAFALKMAETTDNFPDEIGIVMACASTFKGNPAMPNLNAFKGRFIRLDFDGAQQAVVSG